MNVSPAFLPGVGRNMCGGFISNCILYEMGKKNGAELYGVRTLPLIFAPKNEMLSALASRTIVPDCSTLSTKAFLRVRHISPPLYMQINAIVERQ